MVFHLELEGHSVERIPPPKPDSPCLITAKQMPAVHSVTLNLANFREVAK